MKLRGIHHITAIAGDPQTNLDFYTEFLGLRFVKRTVNFDDPSAYHFYFGDRVGTPGSILTFFPWPGARRGTRGSGQVVATTFVIPQAAVGYWRERFKKWHVSFEMAPSRFNEERLRFIDPDGLLLELVGSENLNDAIQLDGHSPVPVEFSLRGFHAPTFELQRANLTIKLLTEIFGFEILAEDGTHQRFSLDPHTPNKQVDVVERPDAPFGHIAAGTVHHIAFRAATDEEQQTWREKLADLGFGVTPIIDRQYFHSIYFREPGGILFEIATDAPGFAIDEPGESLGEMLKLPPQYEEHRAEIERSLPPIVMPPRRASEAAHAVTRK